MSLGLQMQQAHNREVCRIEAMIVRQCGRRVIITLPQGGVVSTIDDPVHAVYLHWRSSDSARGYREVPGTKRQDPWGHVSYVEFEPE